MHISERSTPVPVAIAVWSVGAHARKNLIPAVRAAPSARLAGYATRNSQAAAAVAAEHGGRIFDTPEAMLASPDVDAVLIAGPNAVHFDHARAALEAGKHVFVEKSMGCSLREVEQLVSLASERELLAAECFMYMHHPQFAILRSIADAPERFGRLRTITARFGFPHRSEQDIRYSARLGGGALLDAGAYCLSLIGALTPKLELEWCRLSSPDGHEVDTSGSAAFWAEGTSAFADWGFGRSYGNEAELWCERARVHIPFAFAKPPEAAIEIRVIHQENNRLEVVAVPPANGFAVMIERLVAATANPEERRQLHATALGQAKLIEHARVLSGTSCTQIRSGAAT